MAAPRRSARQLQNPITAGFIIAELREHAARVEAESNGSLLVEPRLRLISQHIYEIEQDLAEEAS